MDPQFEHPIGRYIRITFSVVERAEREIYKFELFKGASPNNALQYVPAATIQAAKRPQSTHLIIFMVACL